MICRSDLHASQIQGGLVIATSPPLDAPSPPEQTCRVSPQKLAGNDLAWDK